MEQINELYLLTVELWPAALGLARRLGCRVVGHKVTLGSADQMIALLMHSLDHRSIAIVDVRHQVEGVVDLQCLDHVQQLVQQRALVSIGED